MWRVVSEAYAYLAGHPFLTDTVLRNRKTDNDQEITKKAICSSRNQSSYKSAHKKEIRRQKTAQIVVVCVPI